MAELKKTMSGKYIAAEVEGYVINLRKEYEHNLKEQRQRIVDLRDENRKLKEEIKVYLDKEKYLSRALVDAEKKAAEIIFKADKQAYAMTRAAENKLEFYNKKIDEYRKKIYEIEDAAIKILKDIIIEVAHIREDEIREEPRTKLDFTVEKAIDMPH